jgi:hypothetical protein
MEWWKICQDLFVHIVRNARIFSTKVINSILFFIKNIEFLTLTLRVAKHERSEELLLGDLVGHFGKSL